MWFTSDTHYAHSNICSTITRWVDAENLTRQFNSLSHMNDTIVNNINSVIKEDDILFHIGDWSFGGFEKIEEFRKRIFCKNVYIILGNHDHHIQRNKDNVQSLFSGVYDYLFLDIIRTISKNKNERYKFVLFHFPIASWEDINKGVIHLHGHCHLDNSNRIGNGKSMDVGMDGNNMMPIRIDSIINLMKSKPINYLTLPKDHHIKNV